MEKTALEFILNMVCGKDEKGKDVRVKDYLNVHDIEQAKEIEKEQHNETWDSAHQAGRFEGKGIAEENWQTFEIYWEETFKSE